jgi:hypothetical protein
MSHKYLSPLRTDILINFLTALLSFVMRVQENYGAFKEAQPVLVTVCPFHPSHAFLHSLVYKQSSGKVS